MSVKVTDLKPYKSLTLAQLPDRRQTRSIINQILTDAKELLDLTDHPDRIVHEERSHKIVSPETGESIWVGFLHYKEMRQPPWYAGDEDYMDITNELFLVFQRERQVGIFMSDTRHRSALERRLGDGRGGGLGALEVIKRGVLNAAYVQGPTRTVWLSGVHAPVTVKADTKMLSGLNLRDALDPLDDQTYHFTAARSSVPKLHLPVGVSPRSSRIWVGATSNWSEFVRTVSALLRHLSNTTQPDLRPLPVVALEATAAPNLEEAFELHFASPELLADSPDIDPETKAMMERWAYRSNFEITKISAGVIHADVMLEESALASIAIELDTSDPEKVKITNVNVERADETRAADIDELKSICHKISWLKVWYESGHAIANGAVFEIRHRNEQFTGFTWSNLSGYDVSKEKFWSGALPPNSHEIIGTKNEDSLFSWVKNNWHNPDAPPSAGSGWLACDDGSMEIADFIHLDDQSNPPVLSLIHVKGAKSRKASRDISVSAYEVVVGQAVKNVRFLDRIHLEEGLEAGLAHKIGKLVWHNGDLRTREDMLKALSKIGASFRRRVVVLQPQVTQKKLEEVRANPHHKDIGRLRQLNTLLHGAQASCRGVSAEFVVLGEAI